MGKINSGEITLPLMQRRELKFGRSNTPNKWKRCLSCRGVNWNVPSNNFWKFILCCLSCRGVNWNTNWCNLFVNRFQLPLMQRRELKFYLSPDLSPREKCCLSCRGVNWNHSLGGYASKQVSCLSCRGVNWNPRGAGNLLCDRVASHVEAWIEIRKSSGTYQQLWLPLM